MSSALKQAKDLASYNNKMERQNIKLQAQYNSELAKDNRDWQEMMSNSAHQREIKDLKAAGLNPVLSVTGGQGASTPSGSAASVSKPNTDMSLPAKVMDMAVAQMNNATQMQIAAMQTANALTIAREQIEESRYEHDTPSGNSVPGMIRNATETIEHVINDIGRVTGASGNVLKGIKTLAFLNHPMTGTAQLLSLLAGWKPPSAKKVSNADKSKNSYYTRKAMNPHAGGTTDMDDMMAFLRGNYDSIEEYYRDMARYSRIKPRKHKVRRHRHR